MRRTDDRMEKQTIGWPWRRAESQPPSSIRLVSAVAAGRAAWYTSLAGKSPSYCGHVRQDGPRVEAGRTSRKANTGWLYRDRETAHTRALAGTGRQDGLRIRWGKTRESSSLSAPTTDAAMHDEYRGVLCDHRAIRYGMCGRGRASVVPARVLCRQRRVSSLTRAGGLCRRRRFGADSPAGSPPGADSPAGAFAVSIAGWDIM